jgi:hypothetical protein
MSAARISVGWALLFVSGILAIFLLTVPESPARRTATEAPVEVCAEQSISSSGSEACAEVAQSRVRGEHPGEAAWLTQC